MHLDGNTIANDTQLFADVCIVGGGLMGMLLAAELSKSIPHVLMLESGGEQGQTAASLDALHIESTGSELEPTPLHRARGFGGTAHVWNTFIENRPAARYFRMDAVDFEARPGLPHGGWPFGVEALAPYYEAVEQQVMPAFSLAEQARIAAMHGLPVDPGRVEVVAEGFGMADVFTERMARQLRQNPDLKVVTHATVTNIDADQDASAVRGVRVVSDAGTSFTVKAGTLVLAAGTLENARLLLASRDVRPAGLGNDHDVVGRYYMDHQRLNAGHLEPNDPALFERSAFFDLRRWGGQYWMGKIKLSQQLIREQQLLNSSTLLWPRPSAVDDRGVDAMKDLARALKGGRFDGQLLRYAGEIGRASRYLVTTGPLLAAIQRTSAPNITRGGWSHLRGNRKRFATFELVQQIEQAPDPDNRVTLGTQRDRYGVQLPRVHARFLPVDLDSAKRSQELLAAELLRAGVGRVVKQNAEFPDLHQTGGIHHPLGTTRMHVDPKQGVVDADSRVHGVRNLFVAGGSVFPTGGYSNPTLSIAALTLRLAAHLRQNAPRFATAPNIGASQ